MTAARAFLVAHADAFVVPEERDLPPAVGAFTTTRRFPVPLPPASAADARAAWPPAAHPKGAALEGDFVRHGCDLRHFLPGPPLWIHQIHGADVADANPGAFAALPAWQHHWRETPPAADAAWTCTPGCVLAVLTADCLPVVIADADATVLGVAHAGWRGLAGGVLENTVARLATAVAPSRLHAWIGPAIGAAAFEVGNDVYEAFGAATDAETARCFDRGSAAGKWRADLAALARLRLRRSGVPHVRGGNVCTTTDAARFYSYRRRRDEGRMATFAWLAPRGDSASFADVPP